LCDQIEANKMKRINGQLRLKIISIVIILILFYYAYKSFSDYNHQLTHEVRSKIMIKQINLTKTDCFQDQLEFARRKGTPVVVSVYYEVKIYL
jgi:hypothetical protein